ncbi:MAG TPA: Flp1 family type IVb pilin [Mobilitalea sp.]|nr:Flp1 family type IVb pilin [Mobilitalea sp.]
MYQNMSTLQVDGIGVIEIILILVIIIGLVLIFREQIQAILQNAFESINSNSDSINSEITIN